MSTEPTSPCIRQCCLDQNDICLGCLRTLPEILAWHGMSTTEKQALLDKLPRRREQRQQGAAMSRSVRSFIGIDLDEATRERLELGVAGYRLTIPGDDWRWIAPANFHLTLAFLGNQDQTRLAQLRQALALRAWFAQPLHLEIKQLGGFPTIRQCRYLVAEIEESPALDQLHQTLQQTLKQAGFPTEERALRPHITLARRKPASRSHPIAAPMQAIPALTLACDRLTLFESLNGPESTRYQALARFT